jgi:signal peptidase I
MSFVADFKTKRFWKEGPGSFAIAIGIALIIRWALLEAYVIPSGSMLPTLLINDHIFVNKSVYGLRFPFTSRWLVKFSDPQRGDVIVFKYPEDTSLFYIKRVVGLPGDKVFYENGNLYINDELIDSKPAVEKKDDINWLGDWDFPGEGAGALDLYLHNQQKLGEHEFSILMRKLDRHSLAYGPWTVPQDSYFVMGDNRDNSRDSRLWSPDKRFVPRDLLVGRASFVWLSCENKLPVLTFLCNPMTLRWGRFGHSVH